MGNKKIKRDLSNDRADKEFLEHIKSFKKSKQQTLLLSYIIEKIAGHDDLCKQVVNMLGDAEIDYKMFNRLKIFGDIYDFCMVDK
jgi:hypothetical protein